MNRVHLVLLWHMHQPDYRDPVTGAFVLPWTRLHALKDYWGMVKLLEEFPAVHATFNLVPSLVRQLQEYAGGEFHEPWFDLAFCPAADLSRQQCREILARAFQANPSQILRRWPRYWELFQKANQLRAAAPDRFSTRDWRDLQVLSQLAWTDEEYLAHHPVVQALSQKGAGFSEDDKAGLRRAQAELLVQVLPEYRRAADRGQIEISTSPFYHPILPLLIHSDVAREANPQTPLLHPPFRHPEDAREQLVRARPLIQQACGVTPSGLWPSEGSVSDQAARIAAAAGFRWLASDEGVLGKSIGVGFWRDSRGLPQNADRLYSPHRLRFDDGEIIALFRDHFISDLVGFSYSRMDPAGAAEDLYGRLRAIGESVSVGRPLTVCLILDGENAWESFVQNGRPFLREFYRRVQADPEIRALTASEAIAAAGDIPAIERLAAGSWINANFDVWFGHNEDQRAWELLRAAHDAYDRSSSPGEVTRAQRDRAYESLLVAEGSDWCWWFGPEHASSDDVDFDSLFRTHLAQVYAALRLEAPDNLAQPIKAARAPGMLVPPSGYLSPRIDGRISDYFEWIGAGLYAADWRGTAMHASVHYLRELRFGFDADHLFVRVDFRPGALDALPNCEIRVIVRAGEELRIGVRIQDRKLAEVNAEIGDRELAGDALVVAFDGILELSIARQSLAHQEARLLLRVALWQGALPLDLLPREEDLELQLGEENFAWALSRPPGA
ncbi:MAG TPA: glycoside hydrolase family 57 protein [Candidatus Acidoferrales bacterium]|nr:glycoside hydrolase family 57 protein [Candidatus Acidoferrales bacterium]